MNISYKREQAGDGIFFSSIINKALKTNAVVINLVTKLENDTASLNAIIPYVLSNSSSKYPSMTALSRKLAELYGANCRGDVLKMADNQFITLVGSCINDRYTFDGETISTELADVMLDCLLSPCVEDGGFAKADFALKKQELLDDISAEINDKRSYAVRNACRLIYENEPCAISVKGDLASAEKIDAVSAYEQYKRILETSVIEILYAGADEPDAIKDKLVGALSKLNRAPAESNKVSFSPLKAEPKNVTDIHDVVQSKMVMGFKSDMDNPTAIKLMNSIFGGTPFSKLFLNVREKLSLCYYCSSGYNDKKGVLIVDSGVEKCNIQKAEEEIINQFNELKAGNFTDKELNEARLANINSLRGVADNPGSIIDWYFSRGFYGRICSPEEEIERLNAVTREDIIEAANSFALDTVYVLTKKED